MHIATLDEFASVIREDLATATEHQLLLEMAEGLVSDELGGQDPWPTIAKTVVLAAAARAYFNPEGYIRESLDGASASRESAAVGVYLTEDELSRLHRWLGSGKPRFSFPGTWPYPDPVERERDSVEG